MLVQNNETCKKNYPVIREAFAVERIVEEVKRTYNLLFDPGTVVELRVLETEKGTVLGYYDEPERLASDAALWSGRGVGVYITIQKIDPRLLLANCNTYKTYAKKGEGTQTANVQAIINLPIDFDHKQRPRGVSATDVEVQECLARADECRAYVRELGWPEPVFACSGNGGHLVYKLALDLNDHKLFIKVFKKLQKLFEDARIGVDQSVSDLAQIWKLYGTKARKGMATEECPHRHAQIIEAPDSLGLVTKEQLLALVETPDETQAGAFDRAMRAAGITDEAEAVLNQDQAAGFQEWRYAREDGAWVRQFSGDLTTLDILGLWEDMGLEIRDDGVCECPWADEHTVETTGTKVWQAEEGERFPGFNCKHSHCEGRGLREVLEKFGTDKVDARCAKKYTRPQSSDFFDNLAGSAGTDGASVTLDRYRLDLEKAGIKVLDQRKHNGSFIYPVECPCCNLIGTFWWNGVTFKNGYECAAGRKTWAEGKALWAAVSETGSRKRRGFLVDELDAIPTPTWIVKDHLLTDSLAIVYGPSNVGKTFFGLDLGLSVATGIKFAGSFDVTQGPVAYAIGEGVGGIKKRIKAWKKAHGHSGPINNFVVIPYQFALAAVDPCEAREIVEIAAGRLGCKPALVIIDTLARNFGAGANENDTAVMSAFVRSCDLIKEECGGSVAVIHHTGKDQSKGMRGAYSLVGGADTIIYCGEHGHRMGMQIECEKQKDVDFFPPYVMLKDVVDLGGDGTSLAFHYQDVVLKTSRGETPIAQWANDAEIVYHLSPETVETAKAKVHIVADVRAGMLARQMTPLGENKVRTLIDTLVLNGRLAATGGEKNEKHTKYYKNSNPSAGFVSDFFEDGDEPAEG